MCVFAPVWQEFSVPQLFGSIFGFEANANSKGYLCSSSEKGRVVNCVLLSLRGSLRSPFLCIFFTQSRHRQNVTAVLASTMKKRKQKKSFFKSFPIPITVQAKSFPLLQKCLGHCLRACWPAGLGKELRGPALLEQDDCFFKSARQIVRAAATPTS